ncbi:MAG: dephospho-CoA kinase [Sphaerochaetaceae bacterium]|nr:dephospho-CoA kinase [Sphaerochaetaceae bacterium]MDC7238128.1 dephospho-CoA kinase [Sphaerochaetaceae bacterium]MDC7249641.1 dephospho-CoA kinase [Sphaerochaetaceae bacterium]
MIVIGLTGKACAGKNQVASVFEEKGFLVIDVDKLGHKALIDKKDDVVKAFGSSILDNDVIDRRKLGNIVFSSKHQLRLLESIVHPYIKQLCIDIIESSDRNVVLNAAILQRGNLVELCSNVIFVKASIFSRYKRSKKRDKRNLIWFLKRELSQRDISIKNLKRTLEVYILNNKKTKKEIYRQIDNYCDIFI